MYYNSIAVLGFQEFYKIFIIRSKMRPNLPAPMASRSRCITPLVYSLRRRTLSVGGFVFPNSLPGDLKFLLQVVQESVELGIILEDIQDRISDPEWQV
jgi:hypothetical protein